MMSRSMVLTLLVLTLAVDVAGQRGEESDSDCTIQCLVEDTVCASNGESYACGSAEASCHGAEVVCKGACPCEEDGELQEDLCQSDSLCCNDATCMVPRGGSYKMCIGAGDRPENVMSRCTRELKMCDDGSNQMVGRNECNDCEFWPCPGDVPEEPEEREVQEEEPEEPEEREDQEEEPENPEVPVQESEELEESEETSSSTGTDTAGSDDSDSTPQGDSDYDYDYATAGNGDGQFGAFESPAPSVAAGSVLLFAALLAAIAF